MPMPVFERMPVFARTPVFKPRGVRLHAFTARRSIFGALLAAVLALQLAPVGHAAAAAADALASEAAPVAVDLPITEVMVFSDRARVTRTGTVRLGSGVQIVRGPDLPGSVLPGSLRVTATGARVVRVESNPVQRERWSIDQVEEWLKGLETQADKVAAVQLKLAAVREELGFLAALHPAQPVPEKDRQGKAAPAIAPDVWRAVQEWLSKTRVGARGQEAGLESELRTLMLEMDRLQREVQRRQLGAFTDNKLELVVRVAPQSAEATLRVEYAVPGASWKPSYDLAFNPDAGKLELRASGTVTQATGEEWPNVKLALSTAIPSLGIELPELLTWTLGDDREWRPQQSARIPPRRIQPFAPPPVRPRVADLLQQADRALTAQRTNTLLAMASNAPQLDVSVRSPFAFAFAADFDAGGGVNAEDGLALGASGYGAGAGSRAYRSAPPASAAPMEKEEAYADEALASSVAAPSYDAPMPAPMAPRPSMKRAPSRMELSELSLASSESDGDVASARGLSLYQAQAWRTQTFGDPLLPAVSAGGFDYVYDAPVAVSVPSQGESVRVPLAVREYSVATFYEATPALAPTAFLKATVKNGSKLPILAGPANVFVNRTFAGDASLATTGPGGTLELPLGADENIRLTHTLVPATSTRGFLVGEEDITDYTVKIEVGNYKKQAVTVRVIDQIPKTNAEKVKVELLSSTPRATAAPDGDGLLAWNVDVPAGGTKTVTFTYRVARPKGWRLSQ